MITTLKHFVYPSKRSGDYSTYKQHSKVGEVVTAAHGAIRTRPIVEYWCAPLIAPATISIIWKSYHKKIQRKFSTLQQYQGSTRV